MSDDTILTLFFFALCGWGLWLWQKRKQGKPSFSVGPGTYTVGKEIPPGKFDLVAEEGFGDFCILERNATEWNHPHQLGFEAPNLADRFRNVTLKRGDTLEVNGDLWLISQPPAPIRDIFSEVLEPGDYKIGLDIPAGTYNLEVFMGEGQVFNDVQADEGQPFFQDMGKHAEGKASCYNKLLCEEGTTLSIRGSLHLKFSKPQKPRPWRWIT